MIFFIRPNFHFHNSVSGKLLIRILLRNSITISSLNLIMLSSCSVMNQQAYIATSPNVNCFEKDHEKNLKFSFFLNHFDIQSNIALSRHFGVSAGIDGAYRGQQIGGELAGIFFKNLNKHNYLEVQAGYGYFKNKSNISELPWDFSGMIGYGQHYSKEVNTNYHKIFLQPTYFWKNKLFKTGLSVKVSANYFDNYHYFYSILDDSGGDYYYLTYESTADFEHKWNFAVEPALKIGLKKNLFLQFSMLFSTNIYNSTVYKTQHAYESSDRTSEYGVSPNPAHLNFLITVGYELKFGKRYRSKG